jgi:hypothetical protein
MKTSPPQILASDNRRCRALGRVAYCLGADLSVAAGAHHRRLAARRRRRRCRPPDGSMAVGAPWPAFHHREPAGGGQQSWHRSAAIFDRYILPLDKSDFLVHAGQPSGSKIDVYTP